MTALLPGEHPRLPSIHVEHLPPTDGRTNRAGRVLVAALPARVRLCGWIPGSWETATPARLRAEARILSDAADRLEAEQADQPADPAQPALFPPTLFPAAAAPGPANHTGDRT